MLQRLQYFYGIPYRLFLRENFCSEAADCFSIDVISTSIEKFLSLRPLRLCGEDIRKTGISRKLTKFNLTAYQLGAMSFFTAY